MRIKFVVLVAPVLFVLSLADPRPSLSAPPPPCQTDVGIGTPFAHCDNAVRDFRSVLLAVHGWNGSCADTFGKQAGSLFSVLDYHRFYDLDCFQYDSLEDTLFDNTAKLRKHIEELSDAGYRRVMLVTHSTGGILALDMLSRLFVDPTSSPIQAKDGIALVRVNAFATPINGLRKTITIAGDILQVFGFSPETLDDLKPGSSVLQDLKQRMVMWGKLYDETADMELKGKIDVPIRYLQGQNDDGVVLAIQPSRAITEGWYWANPSRSKVIDTGQSHTHNVSVSGKKAIFTTPTYVGELIATSAVLGLEVIPRFDQVFPDFPLGAGVPKSYVDRQQRVVRGLGHFANENFTAAFTPAIAFMERMFQESFERSSEVDEELIDGFIAALGKRAARPDDNLVRFLDTFERALSKYDPRKTGDRQSLGHGSSRMATKILDLIDTIRRVVLAYLVQNPDKAYLLASYDGKRQVFADAMTKRISGFLESGHTPVQMAALKVMGRPAEYAELSLLAKATVSEKVSNYLLVNRFKLPADAKVQVAHVFTSLMSSDDATLTDVVGRLNQRVTYLGKPDTPLWRALSDDSALGKLVAVTAKSITVDPSMVKFASDVAAKAGASGNNTGLAIEATNSVSVLLSKLKADPTKRNESAKIVFDAANAAAYGSIAKRLNAIAMPR